MKHPGKSFTHVPIYKYKTSCKTELAKHNVLWYVGYI